MNLSTITSLISPYKTAFLAALVVAVLGGTNLWSYEKGQQKFVALKAEIVQQAKDQQKADDAIVAKDTTVSKEIYDEAQQKLANASSTIDDLNRRLSTSPTIVTSSVPKAGCPAKQPDVVTNGPATPASPGQSPAVAQPVATENFSTIDTEVLRDSLQTGIDAINAEMLFRKWAKGVQ